MESQKWLKLEPATCYANIYFKYLSEQGIVMSDLFFSAKG